MYICLLEFFRFFQFFRLRFCFRWFRPSFARWRFKLSIKLSTRMFCVSIDCGGTFRLVKCVGTLVLLSHAIDHEHHTEYGTQQANNGASNNGCNNEGKTLRWHLDGFPRDFYVHNGLFQRLLRHTNKRYSRNFGPARLSGEVNGVCYDSELYLADAFGMPKILEYHKG